MKLLNLSKEKENVTVELSSDELVLLCNCMYYADEQNNLNNQFGYELYADMIAIRDLCQYGHIDGFCFSQMQKYKKQKNVDKK